VVLIVNLREERGRDRLRSERERGALGFRFSSRKKKRKTLGNKKERRCTRSLSKRGGVSLSLIHPSWKKEITIFSSLQDKKRKDTVMGGKPAPPFLH